MNSADPLTAIASAQGEFEKLTKGSVFEYLSEIVDHCLNNVDGAKDYCKAVSSMWDIFLHDVQDILSSILQEHGCGPEYEVANAVRTDVRHVIDLFTEVEELVISSPSQLGALHAFGRLAYQNCN